VRELWREEKKVWEEVHPDGEEEDDEQEEEEENDKEVQAHKKNGSPEVEIGVEELTLADEIEKKQR